MIREFEGRTEQEAIAKAIEELNIEREDFDVEIIEPARKGLFKKNSVKIRIHFDDGMDEEESYYDEGEDLDEPFDGELEDKVLTFVATVLEKMGYAGNVSIAFRKERKIGLRIDSENSNIIIGRKGKNLDALQLLTNVFVGQQNSNVRVIVDSENYRIRHEEQLIRLAYRTAEHVVKSGQSRLLEPMNPYERRLVHTALNDFGGVETKSEGDGLYKQVRVIATN
ncbi:MAG TPA: RNA-binding cell elongation regulator Jag/EloR [Sphaerochaeta sp.]|jgi:spoIIIJ-associated protein|nr:protein jag [Spirochaetales bacterium]HPX29327.1 RNA-binding cell elongation regulator Jag/EloR [Sphaerochaeta sp.]